MTSTSTMSDLEGPDPQSIPPDGGHPSQELEAKFPNFKGTGNTDLPKMPKMLGEPAEAIKVFAEYTRLMRSAETQKMFDEKLDFNDPNVLVEMRVLTNE